MYYKSQLHELAQKLSWATPHFEFVKQGASHQPQFQVSVEVNGVVYRSEPGYPTLKAAEHAAAKQALDALEGALGVKKQQLYKLGLCKNILQEYAQKAGLSLPKYRTTKSGEEHNPTFTTTVEIGGMLYCGGPGKCKKEAEVKAAKVAMIAIQDLGPDPAQAAPPPPPPPPFDPPPPPPPPAEPEAPAAAAVAGSPRDMQDSKKRSRASDVSDFIGQLGLRVKLEEPQHHQNEEPCSSTRSELAAGSNEC